MLAEFAYDDEKQIILRGTQIVVPTSIQTRVVQLAHEGHLGCEKVKSRIRQSFWFPGIDAKVTKYIATCRACAVNKPKERHPPLKMQAMPEECWTVIAADFCGPTPSNTYLLLVVDEHSRFPFVVEVNSTGHASTIKGLTTLFSMFGIPKTVKTDNGPPFNGKDFAEFLGTYGVRHQRSTPLWPEANGMVERFVRTVKKALRTSVAEGENWKAILPDFLLAYRNTPHASTGVSPAQLFLGRKLRDKLSLSTGRIQPESDPANIVKLAMNQDAKHKLYNKSYGDKNRHVSPRTVKEGDKVFVRPDKKPTSFAPRYDPQPYTVTEVRGTAVTAARDDKSLTRNVSWFTPAEVQPEENQLTGTSSPTTSGTSNGQTQPDISRPKRTVKVPKHLQDFITK